MLRHHLFHSVIAAIVLLAAACAAPTPQGSAPPAATAAPAAAATKAFEPPKGPVAASPTAPKVALTPPSPVVAILVVDSFTLPTSTSTITQTREAAKKPSTNVKNVNCLTTPDGQGFRSDGATAYPVGNSTVAGHMPHGHLVYEQVKSSLTSESPLFLTVVTATTSSLLPGLAKIPDVVQLFKSTVGPDAYILLVPVHIESFNTETAAGRIVAATNALSATLSVGQYQISASDIRGVVVNMSFAVVPCGDSGLTGLLQYEQELSKNQQVSTDLAKLREAIRGEIGRLYKIVGPNEKDVFMNDPLRCLINPDENCAKRANWPPPKGFPPVVFVAAAGNSGLGFPFAPALWPEVLSVSAQKAEDVSGRADYSNSGEVMMSGLEKLTYSLGTSFATPKLAALEARYLLRRSTAAPPPCTIPPLGHKPNGWDTVQAAKKNLSLSDATKEYCTSFLP
jgi:hypothetical protein